MIRVVLVDDHHIVRAGLAGLLATRDDVAVVGEAADGAQAAEVVRRLEPDVVLMDISMPGYDGIRATRDIVAQSPGVAVVALTTFADDARVIEMLRAGAVGYLLKDCAPDEVLRAIHGASNGAAPIDPRVAGALLPGRARPGGDADVLSAREQQVVRLVAKGLTNKQVGRELGIAERTVKVHLGNIFRRIGVLDRTSAAMWARDHLAPTE